MPEPLLPPRLTLPVTLAPPAIAAPPPPEVPPQKAPWWRDKALRRHPVVLGAMGVVLLATLVPSAVWASHTLPGPWQAWVGIGTFPVPPPTATLAAGGPPGADLMPHAAGAHAFICVALPWARYAQTLQLMPYTATPGPHPYIGQDWYLNSQPFGYPWYVSVILGQWLVEQGTVTPTFVGYNWGNSSGTPGFPAVGGTGIVGSPDTFAYGATALDGVEIYEINTRYHFYPSVWHAYPAGPIAQAKALGASPWDYGHYEPGGTYPGYLIVDRIQRLDLTRFDDPHAAC
jgi:hypothetical protein